MIDKALDKFKQINQINPNEALECLKSIEEHCKSDYEYCISCYDYEKELSTIKQALIKAQELKSENNALLGENNALLEENNNLYVELTFSDKQHKELIENTKQYKKMLEIIKEKDVDIYILQKCKTVDEYNSKIVHIVGETRELAEEEFKLLKEWLK